MNTIFFKRIKMSTSVITSKKMSGSRYPKHTSLEQHDDESSSTKSSTFINPAAKAKGAKVAVLIDARASPSPRKNNYVQKQDQLNHLSKNPRLKQTDAVNGVTQEFPVSSREVHTTCYKEVTINFGMSRSQHLFIKKNETELDLTPSIPIESEDLDSTTTNGDAPTRKKKSTHYGTGQSSPRSNIIECAKELIIMESCSTKPNVLGNIKPVIREDEDEEEEPFPTETLSKDKLKLKLRRREKRRVGHSKGRTTRQHTSPTLVVVAVGAARGKDTAVAVHVSNQEHDTKSFTTIDCIDLDPSTCTKSTSKVEKEMTCDSDQADGDARSARTTPLPSPVWTSQEETLVAGKCLLEMGVRTDNISTPPPSVLVFVSTSTFAQDQEQDQGKSQIMSDQDQTVASKVNMEERHDLPVNHEKDAVEQGAKEVVILMSVPFVAVTLNTVTLAVMKKKINFQELFATELASEETLRDAAAAAAHPRTQLDARVAKMDSLDVNSVAGMEISLENENCSIDRQSGSESEIQTIKKLQNSYGSSSRSDDSQHGTAGIDGEFFPFGSSQAAAKEEPLCCHDGASFLSHTSKKNLVSIIFFYCENFFFLTSLNGEEKKGEKNVIKKIKIKRGN